MKETPRTLNRIAQPIKSLAQRFAYMGLIIGAFGLMLLGKVDTILVERMRAHVTDAFAPILDGLSRPAVVVSEWVAAVEEIYRIRAENARLRDEVTALQVWQTNARQLEAENRGLRELMNFAPGPEISFVTSRVIADTGGAFVHSVLSNAGDVDGVRKGQVVVTGDGLVGRVQGVGRNSSRILLITDLNSRIPVLIEPDRTRAILAGDNSERPRLIHLPPGATVATGDRVVTSGHGGVFPPGVPIGVVSTVSDGGIGVQPYVDRNKLEYVRVLDYGLSGTLAQPETTTAPVRPKPRPGGSKRGQGH